MRSEHPLGKAIVAHAAAAGLKLIEPEGFDYWPRRGVAASVNGSRILVGNRTLMAANVVAPWDIPDTVDESGSHVMVARDGHFAGTITSEIPSGRRPKTQLRH